MTPSTPTFWSAYLQDDTAGSAAHVRVALPWDEQRDLVLTADELGKALELVDRTGGATSTVGWWDDARWHPFALRWSELVALTDEWSHGAEVAPTAPIPMLLLAPFVGFGVGDEAERADACDRVARALASIGCAPADTDRLAARALLPVSEDDYRWTLDPHLGWTFGGEYACYSLRNAPHAGGEEGRFPFEAFRQRFAWPTGR